MTQNIFVYMDFQVAWKREAGKDSTADLYRVVRNRLYRFWKGASLQWTDITAAMVDDFGSSLRAEGLAVNTVNSYLAVSGHFAIPLCGKDCPDRPATLLPGCISNGRKRPNVP